ncbi:MAG: pilus assembly protein CpaE [Actinomycetota bacterium]|jgi:pilus assembly protein CpaE
MFARPSRAARPEPTAAPGLRIAVVELDGDLTARVAALFPEHATEHVQHVDDAIKGVFGPTVVVIGPDAMSEATLQRIEELRDIAPSPSLCVVLAVPKISTAVLRRALRAGISDVADSTSDTELFDVLERAMARVQTILAPGGVDAPAGRVVAVFSPKGGVGTTTVAVNLAASPRVDLRPHMIIDADLPFGDVAVSLSLDPKNSLADATGSDLDTARLKGLLQRSSSDETLALVAPADPSRAELISAADVGRAIELSRQLASLIVVDTAAAFDDVTLAVLEHADDVVLVSTTDVASVKNAKIALQTLKQLDVAPGRITLVLNRVPSHPALPVADIEKALGLKAVCIPEDAAVAKATHRAAAVVVESPKAGASRAYARLSDQLGLSSLTNS